MSRWMQVVAAAVLIGLVAGGAYAVGAASGRTVRACAKRRGGALRLASKCKKSEKRVTWSKVGPTGPAGTDGAPGTPGTPGAPGSARAYAWVNAAGASTPDFREGKVSGFTGVTMPSNGYYCLTLPASIDATKVAPVATPVENPGFAGIAELAYVLNPVDQDAAHDCDGANAIEVDTQSKTGSSASSPTPNLDFTVVVP